MSEAIIKKNGTDYPLMTMPNHYPADRVYLDGDTTKNVQDKVARKADLTNLDLTGTTNTTGSTIASGTFFYLNGTLVRAKSTISSGATFTENTNYEVVTAGGLNNLENRFKPENGYYAGVIQQLDTSTYALVITLPTWVINNYVITAGTVDVNGVSSQGATSTTKSGKNHIRVFAPNIVAANKDRLAQAYLTFS